MSGNRTQHILVVDDDSALRRGIAQFLEKNGFRVTTAGSGSEADRALRGGERIDLVVLDLMLPGEDGLAIIRRWKDERPPIIMLSAMGEGSDRIIGLEVGADDYVAKPCNPRELLARIRAVLRRGHVQSQTGPQCLYLDDWEVDLVARTITREAEEPVSLTDSEFRVLTALISRPRQVLSRDQLINATHGYQSDVFDRVVDVAISRLRKKMVPCCPIRTVRSEGYMLTVAPSPK
ncbi:response regulator [Novosphingobium rosa]|uniref:response regulator n=1 Tax=Novosphingobium rosa TaxID=76978 RepID=UPI0008357E53|nr:response regulator transcription factor [Novosphingobium rosa]